MSVAVAHDMPLVGAAFVAGSVLPDLDVFFMVLGKRFYLRHHQGITHSLILAPVFALLPCLVLMQLPGEKSVVLLWLAALAGIGVHVTLDWFNTFRIGLFAPFSRRRFSLDAVFFIDSVALSLTGLFYLLHVVFELTAAEYLYPLAFAAYFLLKLVLHNRVLRELGALFVIPSSLNPVVFYVLEKGEDGLNGYLYNAATRKVRSRQGYPKVDEQFHLLATQSSVFNEIKQITRAFHIVEVTQNENGITIVAADLAVRNFGGRFARTELRFDPRGRLVHEVANI